MIDERLQARREDAFVVRIWREPVLDGGPVAWRALVQHLESGERRFFTNYGELCEFLDRYLKPR